MSPAAFVFHIRIEQEEIGVTPKVKEIQKFALFDGIAFDAKEPEKYAKAFPIHNMS